MLKNIYRVIILLGIFVAALFYFSRDIKEVVFDTDNKIVMEDATFPLVTIKTDDKIINLLHGYSSNLNANVVREAVTPVGADQSFEVSINQENYIIKKMNYELREFSSNSLIESNSISVFEDDGKDKTAKISYKAELEKGKDYAVKLTLITSESMKIYYYQRIKLYDDSHLKEKLSFIMDFHNKIMDKDKAKDIVKYLEPDNDNENTSLTYVDIHSSFDLVSWGNMKPAILTEVIPTVKEIYTDTASVELNYFVETDNSDIREQYQVTEFYRVRYSADRMYLLNYERRMEALFDPNLANVSKSELRLGLSSDYEVSCLESADEKKLVFVRDRELWFYDLDKNEMVQVFSFRQEKTDYLRDLYDRHDIRVLSMDEEGNVDFLVYGYMNRGQYEGKVAVILYQYIRSEGRIEELVYIPVEESYQTLKENLGEFAFINAREIFYFHINDTVYSYNLITRELSEMAAGVHKNDIVVLEDKNYVVWQEGKDALPAGEISIMNMETGEIQTIGAPAGYYIRLLGKIDSNIIYGFVKKDDIAVMMDGSILAPVDKAEIATVDKKVLKSYERSGYYISGIKVNDNIITLDRVKKVEQSGRITYVHAEDDYIINQVKEKTAKISVKAGEEAELYLTLPKDFTMEAIPGVSKTMQTVISQDPTVRLPENDSKPLYYYSYVTGGISGAYEEAAGAIKDADKGIGVVLDSSNRLVWERGVKTTQYTIPNIANLHWDFSGNPISACLELMLSFQGVKASKTELSVTGSSAYEVLAEKSLYTPVSLTGITLDEALYYVSLGRPVLAMTDHKDAVIIYGYDAFNIIVMDPDTGKTDKIGINDGTRLFANAGNVYLSYLGEKQ